MQPATLRIARVEICKMSIPLKEPFVTSLGVQPNADNVIVILRTAEGLIGYGECSPFLPVNGETQDTCLSVGKLLGRSLLGKNPLDIAHCSMVMDALIYANTSIKCAFDIALHDIASQHAGIPLYKFLKGKKRKLVTDYTVSIGESEKMADDAAKIKKDGYLFIKVKVGGTKEKDVYRIRSIREKIGNEIPLRLDANQGWDVETAAAILAELASDNIEYCEQPVPRWDYSGLAALTKQSPVRIMADESCGDHHDARHLLDHNACHYFNLKLGKSSGLHKAMKIIRLAEAAGISMQVGGFLESRLGFTASAHLALTSERIRYCDFDSPLFFNGDPVIGGIHYGSAGEVIIPDSAGLGATIDEEFIGEAGRIVVE